MPRKRSSDLNDSQSNESCDSESSEEDLDSSSSEEESDLDAANAEVQSDSDDDEGNVPLINWRQIKPNTPIDFSRFPFTGKPGITIPADKKWTQLDYLKLFVDEKVVEKIVTETNRFAEQYITKNITSEAKRLKYGWYNITTDEFWAFFAILMYQAIIKKPKQRWYWSKNKMFQTPFAINVMSCDRFEKIMKFLHFSNNENYDPSKHPCPKLHKIWEIYKMVNENFQKIYVPERDIAIDESLMPSKHHVGWLQWIPSKRARKGMKFYDMCESNSGYIVKSILYLGKDTEKDVEFQNVGATTSIVLEIGKDLFHQGYCFIMDNFYNSPELYEILQNKRTDAYGTIKTNRKGLPENFSKIKLNKEEAVCWQKEGIVVMKWKDKKDVSLISTCHDVSFKEVQPKYGPKRLKPSIVLDYNYTMGGVDTSYQQMISYTLMRKQQKKYYKKLFRHLMDKCLFNAYVLFKKYVCKSTEHLAFLVQIIVKIIHVHVKNLPVQVKNCGRKRIERSLYGDTTPARLTERHFPKFIPATDNKSNPTKRCTVCSSTKQGKKNRKETRYYCKECDVALCVVPCFEIYHTEKNY